MAGVGGFGRWCATWRAAFCAEPRTPAARCRSAIWRRWAGILSHGSPAADTATPLLALDAEVVVAHLRGRKKLPLADFYLALGKGILHESLMVEVADSRPRCVPDGGRSTSWAAPRWISPLVNVAAGLQLDARGRVKWARIALGAVAPTPVRATGAEQLAVGRTFDEACWRRSRTKWRGTSTRSRDVRASAEYRREMCRVLDQGGLLEECRRNGVLAMKNHGIASHGER